MPAPGGHPQDATEQVTAAGVAPLPVGNAAAPGLPVFPFADVRNASVKSYAATLAWLRPPKPQAVLSHRLIPDNVRKGRVRKLRPVMVHVWVHFGIHMVKAVPPSTQLHPDSPIPSGDEAKELIVGRCRFQSLLRYRLDGGPTLEVDVREASLRIKKSVLRLNSNWSSSEKLWQVTLKFPGSPTAIDLTFVAHSEEYALEWKRQLQLRVVPLETLLASQTAFTPVGGGASTAAPGGSGEGTQGTVAINGTTGALRCVVVSAKARSPIALCIQRVLPAILATPLSELFSGSLSGMGLHVAASASGVPAASMLLLLAHLNAAAAVFEKVQALPVVAAELRSKVRGLGEALTGSIYPAAKLLKDLPKDAWTHGRVGSVLLDSIHALASDLDVMLGRLINVSLMSTTQRVSQLGAPGNRSPEAELVDEVDALKAEVKDLLDFTVIQLVTCSVSQLERVTTQVQLTHQQQKAAEQRAQRAADRHEKEAAERQEQVAAARVTPEMVTRIVQETVARLAVQTAERQEQEAAARHAHQTATHPAQGTTARSEQETATSQAREAAARLPREPAAPKAPVTARAAEQLRPDREASTTFAGEYFSRSEANGEVGGDGPPARDGPRVPRKRDRIFQAFRVRRNR